MKTVWLLEDMRGFRTVYFKPSPTQTRTKGHPVECAACGTSPDEWKDIDGIFFRVYFYICDNCEDR